MYYGVLISRFHLAFRMLGGFTALNTARFYFAQHHGLGLLVYGGAGGSYVCVYLWLVGRLRRRQGALS